MYLVMDAIKNQSIALANFADAIDYGEKYFDKFVVIDEDEYVMYDSMMDELVNELTEYTVQ